MGLKCGLFPVSFAGLLEWPILKTREEARAVSARSFLHRVVQDRIFPGFGETTTLQKQRDCWLVVLGRFGRAGRP